MQYAHPLDDDHYAWIGSTESNALEDAAVQRYKDMYRGGAPEGCGGHLSEAHPSPPAGVGGPEPPASPATPSDSLPPYLGAVGGSHSAPVLRGATVVHHAITTPLAACVVALLRAARPIAVGVLLAILRALGRA